MRNGSLFRGPGRGAELKSATAKILAPRVQIGTKPRLMATVRAAPLWHSPPPVGEERQVAELRESARHANDSLVGPGASGPRCDAELLESATAMERDFRSWEAEFRWLLAHPAVGPIAGDEVLLTLRSIAGQHAATFPLVSGDAQWLRERSMPVIARRLAPLLARGREAALDVTAVARSAAGAAARL